MGLGGQARAVVVTDQLRPDAELLGNIRRDLHALASLASEVRDTWTEEDLVYRFWHQSFKVYWIQELTLRIVGALENLAPDAARRNSPGLLAEVPHPGGG